VSVDRRQRLRVLEDRFVIEHVADKETVVPAEGWLALVRGPDGLTAIRRDDDATHGTWVAFWSGDEPHDPDATGMLSALVSPLAAREVPVMVASTYHADLVLVPAARVDAAVTAMRDAGHVVVH
jgi:hypothetical protein